MNHRLQTSVFLSEIISLKRTIGIRRISSGKIRPVHLSVRLFLNQFQKLRNCNPIAALGIQASAEITDGLKMHPRTTGIRLTP